MSELSPTERTKVKRVPHKAATDMTALYDLLDQSLVAHVGIVEDGQPFVLPVVAARFGDQLLLHGSSASRLMKTIASGAPICVTLTILDGLVLARSAFESSMNYRSAMILGSARALEGAEKLDAFLHLTEKLFPERSKELRSTTEQETKATLMVSMPLNEASVKISNKFPADPVEEYSLPIWAGVLPIKHTYGEPIPDPNLIPGTPIPDYLSRWPEGRT
jgi:nitroimidazol reductase NimA-like FMN-containing flavoprotein (pyridoxamine 5'-phosphate oxidase superfamily)